MKPTVFPHYVQTVYKTSPFYLISLEAWRRGLSVTFSGDIKNFTVSSPQTTRVFSKSMVLDPEMGLRTHEICENKDEAKKYLAEAGVPVPRGRRFTPFSSDEEIVRYARETGYPVVLKPSDGYMGKGVFSNIQDEALLKELLVHVRRELEYPDVMIEERIEGGDFRIFVLGDEVVAALQRVPANVTGNGRDTIRKLIRVKNAERRKNPNLTGKLIKEDREVLSSIKKAGYVVNSILGKEETLFLREKCNVSSGGDSIDVTEELPKHVKETAIRAVRAIPGLNHAGVDVLYDARHPGSKGVVIEINSMAEIGGMMYPFVGTPRDIPSAIIDRYFPDSMGDRGRHRLAFYDPESLKQTLKKEPETTVTLPPLPVRDWARRELIVSGRTRAAEVREWVREKALQMGLSGFTELNDGKTVRIVIAGDEKQVQEFERMCGSGSAKAGIRSISASDYADPVITGFRIIHKKNPILEKAAHLAHAVWWRMKKRIKPIPDRFFRGQA
ncbi:MAG: acylphosphatase [Desulfobacterales bacterium]